MFLSPETLLIASLVAMATAVGAARGKGWTPKADGWRPRLGHFAIDRIDPDGTVHAGCHHVPGFAVEWAARQAGVICE